MSATVLTWVIGKVFAKVEVAKETIDFVTSDGETWRMYHEQDCCESVEVEDVTGDTNDLIGVPIMSAEERAETSPENRDGDGYTYTFYDFRTIKGSVSIRWCGFSNGYYSEGVTFERVAPSNDGLSASLLD